jgi:hypothetical protein
MERDLKGLLELVLKSPFFRNRTRVLLEDINEHTYWVVQRTSHTTWPTMYYDSIRQSLSSMIFRVAEHIWNIDLINCNVSMELQKCQYYQSFLNSILKECIRMNFKVHIIKILPRRCDTAVTQDVFFFLQGLVNKTYFSIFGYPFYFLLVENNDTVSWNVHCSINFEPFAFITGPKNKLRKKSYVC